MSAPIPCKFKREANPDGSGKGDWEPGTMYGFSPVGEYDMPWAIVSATNDAATLIIPIGCVALVTGDPDAIKAAFEKTKADKAAAAKAAEKAKAVASVVQKS